MKTPSFQDNAVRPIALRAVSLIANKLPDGRALCLPVCPTVDCITMLKRKI